LDASLCSRLSSSGLSARRVHRQRRLRGSDAIFRPIRDVVHCQASGQVTQCVVNFAIPSPSFQSPDLHGHVVRARDRVVAEVDKEAVLCEQPIFATGGWVCISRRCWRLSSGTGAHRSIGGVSINRCALMAERARLALAFADSVVTGHLVIFEEISDQLLCDARVAGVAGRSPSSR